MDNPEKLATLGTQDSRRQTKQKHNTIYVGHHYAQPNTNNVNNTTGGKEEPSIGNGSEYHNTGLRMSRHLIGQHKNLKKMYNMDIIITIIIIIVSSKCN